MKVGETWKLKIVGRVFVKITDIDNEEDEIYFQVSSSDIDDAFERSLYSYGGPVEDYSFIIWPGQWDHVSRDIFIKMYEKVYD